MHKGEGNMKMEADVATSQGAPRMLSLPKARKKQGRILP